MNSITALQLQHWANPAQGHPKFPALVQDLVRAPVAAVGAFRLEPDAIESIEL